MKKLMCLLVAGTMFIFTACNCGAGDTAVTDAVEEVVACTDDCLKACCLGCQAEGGGACLDDHSCCATHEADAHEGHDHEGHDHEGHDHE